MVAMQYAVLPLGGFVSIRWTGSKHEWLYLPVKYLQYDLWMNLIDATTDRKGNQLIKCGQYIKFIIILKYCIRRFCLLYSL